MCEQSRRSPAFGNQAVDLITDGCVVLSCQQSNFHTHLVIS